MVGSSTPFQKRGEEDIKLSVATHAKAGMID